MRFCACNTFCRALSDEIAFELTDGGEHVKQQAASRRCCVDCLVENNKIHVLLNHLLGQLCQITNGAGKPVQTRDQELIALAHVRQGVFKFRAIGLRTSGLLFLKDLLRSSSLKLFNLGLQVLARGGHTGITDLHVSKVLGNMGRCRRTRSETQFIEGDRNCKSMSQKPWFSEHDNGEQLVRLQRAAVIVRLAIVATARKQTYPSTYGVGRVIDEKSTNRTNDTSWFTAGCRNLQCPLVGGLRP